MKNTLPNFSRRAVLLGLMFLICVAAVTTASAKGRKYGLFIGINEYPDTIGALGGCINDAKKMQSTMVTKYGFKSSDTTLLLDAAATRDGIINQIKRYEKLAGAGDIFIMHYSGHGSLFPDKFSEEQDETKFTYYESDGEVIYPRDKYDATILPVDADEETSGKPWKNMILDDELYAMFAPITEKGAQVVFISDSCFSGSIARPTGAAPIKERFVPLYRVFGAKSYADLKLKEPAKRQTVTAPPQLNNLYLTLTGANNNETASDGTGEDATKMGLFTETLYKALNAKGANKLSYAQLMQSVSARVKASALAGRHNQNPQLDTRYGNPKAMIFTVPAAK